MAQSQSIKREKWVRLSLSAGYRAGLDNHHLPAGVDGRCVV